jgi:chromosome segregation ATPase
MDWSAFVSGAGGAAVLGIILKLIDVLSNRNKTRADAAKIIVEGGAQAVNTMRELLKDLDQINDEQRADIDELKAGKKERLKIIEDLQNQINDLVKQNEDLVAAHLMMQKKIKETDDKQQQDLEETQRLRNDYAIAQKQIIKLEDLAIGLGEYVDTIKKALQKAEIPLPLNGALLESVLRLKAERAMRGKQ